MIRLKPKFKKARTWTVTRTGHNFVQSVPENLCNSVLAFVCHIPHLDWLTCRPCSTALCCYQ